MILAALLLLKLSTTTAATLLTLVAWLAPSSCADGQLETPDGLWCLQLSFTSLQLAWQVELARCWALLSLH